MPSPVGHSLAALAFARAARSMDLGRETDPPAASSAVRSRRAFLGAGLLIFAANAPDLDFLPGVFVGEPGRFHHAARTVFCGRAVWPLCLSCRATLAVSIGRPDRHDPRPRVRQPPDPGHVVHRPGAPQPRARSSGRCGARHSYFPFAVFFDIRHGGPTGTFFRTLFIPHNMYAVLWEAAVVAGIWAVVRAMVRLVSMRMRLTRDQPDRL